MGRRGRNSTEASGQNSNAWMITFSDLVMLLLTFFVLLLTMSTLDRKALKEMISYLNDSLGVLEFSDMSNVKTLSALVQKYNISESKLIISHDKVAALCKQCMNYDIDLKDKMKDIDQLIRIKEDEKGLSFSFNENIFFKSGTTEIDEANYGILESIANIITENANDILIMGHTDNTPIISDKYPSNWELSVHRGLAVLDYLLGKEKLSPERFAVGGYGCSQPLDPDDTQEGGVSNNRRVEIVFRPIKES